MARLVTDQEQQKTAENQALIARANPLIKELRELNKQATLAVANTNAALSIASTAIAVNNTRPMLGREDQHLSAAQVNDLISAPVCKLLFGKSLEMRSLTDGGGHIIEVYDPRSGCIVYRQMLNVQ
jgi:hypothetical protein